MSADNREEKKPIGKKPKPKPEGAKGKAADAFELPAATVQRIIKSALPEGVQVGKDAKAAFCKAASIFVYYITAW